MNLLVAVLSNRQQMRILIHHVKISSVCRTPSFFIPFPNPIKTEIISQEHPSIKIAVDFLMALQGNPAFPDRPPSTNFTEFLSRLENAQPCVETYTEDDMGQGWGHVQYNGGNLKCSTVLDSWDSVGSPQNACQLIAAGIKTCRTARHLCQDQDPQPSYLADAYLQEAIELMWKHYQEAIKVCLVSKKSDASLIVVHCRLRR